MGSLGVGSAMFCAPVLCGPHPQQPDAPENTKRVERSLVWLNDSTWLEYETTTDYLSGDVLTNKVRYYCRDERFGIEMSTQIDPDHVCKTDGDRMIYRGPVAVITKSMPIGEAVADQLD